MEGPVKPDIKSIAAAWTEKKKTDVADDGPVTIIMRNRNLMMIVTASPGGRMGVVDAVLMFFNDCWYCWFCRSFTEINAW